jgi:hypothetical protein
MRRGNNDWLNLDGHLANSSLMPYFTLQFFLHFAAEYGQKQEKCSERNVQGRKEGLKTLAQGLFQ